MTAGNHPITKEFVLLGGGHAHVAVLKSFAMRPLPGVQLTLVTKDIHTPYSGMLPGLIAGHYKYDDAHIDLRPLARLAGANIVNATASGLALEEQRVQLLNRPSLRFDILSINTGSTPGMKNVPGASKHALPVKPIERFLNGWADLKCRIQSRNTTFRFAIVGGGAGGVELLLSMRHALRKEIPNRASSVEFSLFTADDTILPTHARGVQSKYAHILSERNVQVHTNSRVQRVDTSELEYADGRKHSFDVLIWATNASAPSWVAESGLATDTGGFIAVNSFLQSTSHPAVFASGDVAAMLETPRPKSGVFAVRQGPPLSYNLRAAAVGRPLEPFRPQQRFLSLISTGDQRAVASWGPFSADGDWIWRWKDGIDRRWMRQYQDVEFIKQQRGAMPPPVIEAGDNEERMRCGGCGAKVSARILRHVLRRLDVSAGDDAAVLDIPPATKLIQSVDFFREFVADPFLFGQIAAHHSLNDLFAMGAQPDSAMATVVVPFGDEAVVEESVYQMLAGAREVLDAHGAKLVGGHTAEGTEAALGLTVNGHHEGSGLFNKQGLRDGDHLILTKALGTGVIFAADMRSKAKGRWVDSAVDSMLNSNAPAAKLFAKFNATAATDVTGFGLVGHLSEMLSGTSLQANLSLDNLPLLDGVRHLSREGVSSSLLPANQSSAPMEQSATRHEDISKILYDPQTAGGLLAGISAERAEACVERLREIGYPKAQDIGIIRTKNGENEFSVRIA
ncbi:MAG: selenide, water dikinase SelD [Limisphaerales bacterium]